MNTIKVFRKLVRNKIKKITTATVYLKLFGNKKYFVVFLLLCLKLITLKYNDFCIQDEPDRFLFFSLKSFFTSQITISLFSNLENYILYVLISL